MTWKLLKGSVWRTEIALLLWVVQPSHVLAQSVKSFTPWMALTGGVGGYAMSDINSDLRALDDALPEDVDEISRGLALGADLGADVGQLWRFGIHYQRLFAASSVFHESGPYSFFLGYDVPAHVISGSAALAIASRVRLGVSGGMVGTWGNYQIFSGLQMVSAELDGIGPYIDAHLSIDLPVGPQAAFVPLLGYRSAVVTISEPNEPELELDYSGVILTVALKINLAGNW